MSTLHIVNAPDVLDRVSGIASAGDAILLIENGVYAASVSNWNSHALASAPPDLSYFVLKEDLAARALFAPLQEFTPVSYADFVELVCQHNNSINWS
ncbi:MAG: sulfurtransferase complex subunit TusB [Pseudohongiella sp.]|nr:sulfurtransferase complex subunit TusB [Pseudohongiella sp.]MDP2127635.1 sulfurtransferase complex subunit TusB [Pseudohongiella sp.]